MSAKSLKRVDRAIRSEPEGVAEAAYGRAAKRHERSVHREPGRPQGSRSPQRHFSPVISVEADDDGVNVPEVSTNPSANGELGKGPSGFEAVACLERSELELGRPLFFPRGDHEDMANQLKEDRRDGAEESDPPIVVRDGRADHMAKGWAERQREHSTHLGRRLLPFEVSSTLLAIAAGLCFDEADARPSARLSEEPGAGKPHAGICEGGTR
jgi:hypothetical protein